MSIIQEKIERLKAVYEPHSRPYFTDDCEHITSINFETLEVCYFVYVTSQCECCSHPEDREMDLEMLIQYMSDSDFETMIDHYKGEKKQYDYITNAE
jgi:biotin synthase-related radical SAM superfamily protein